MAESKGILKLLPVGTIRVGEGLTDSQKENLDEREAWSKLLSALHGISWLRTEEGNMFWRVLADRANNVMACMDAEKKRREAPQRTHVAHFTVCAKEGKVDVSGDAYMKDVLLPESARELAAALNKHADAAEGRFTKD